MWGAGSTETPWESGDHSQEDHQFGLSQESFGLSQSQSQSQYGADIGLSQYSLSQQSQSGSQRRSAVASAPTCLVCQSTDIITTDGGDMVCAACGTAYEGNVNEVTEVDTGFVPGAARRRHVKTRKDEKIPGRLDTGGWPKVFASTRECLEAFQLALDLNVKAFCEAAELSGEAALEVKRVASEVWFPYLERLTLPPACGHGGIRIRNEFRTRWELGNVISQPPQGGGAGEGPGAINVDEGTLRAFGGDTKLWNWVIRKAQKVPGYTVPPLSLEVIPAILCVCARWMRSPILAVDVARWMRDGSLPFKGCFMRFPESVRMGLGLARHFFMPSTVPSPQHISNLADRLAAMLGLELPPLNVLAVARRLVDGMGMPAPVLSAVETLACFSVGNPCAPNPATARKRAFRRVQGKRLVRSKKTAMTSSPGVSGGGSGSGSKGKKRGGDSESGIKRQDGRRQSDSNGVSGSSSSSRGRDTCDEAGNADRARRKLRSFLSDASPLHVMALVVAAAKGCPGWDSWRYARPALLPPPPTPEVPAKEAGTRESTGVVTGADGAFARPRSSKGSIGVGQGAGTGTTTYRSSRREDSRAPFLFPSHPAELRLLLRGRLPEYLRRLEESSGGVEFGRQWTDSSAMSPALEAVADEIEKRRRQEQLRLRDEPALAARVSTTSVSSLRSGNRQGQQSFDADGVVLMGAVRAAHVVAGARLVTEEIERRKEEDKRPLPPVPVGSNSVETRPEDVVTAAQLKQAKEEIVSSSSTDAPSRVPRDLAGREAEGKRDGRRKYNDGARKGAVVVYDPDELTSRFHPHYELLVEACACYVEVPPYMLQELVEKLDCILVDHAQREYRRTQGYPSWFESKSRKLLRQVGRVEPETVERRDVFGKRENCSSIHRRFISPRPTIHRSFVWQPPEASDTERDDNFSNLDAKGRFWAAVKRINQVDPFKPRPKPTWPEYLSPAPAIAILGGDTLRPPPFQPPIFSRAVAEASIADKPAAAAASAASATGSASAEHEPEAAKGGGGAEEGGEGVPSPSTKPKDEEVRWLLHSVGAGSDPFVDDDYTEGIGRSSMFCRGVDIRVKHKVRARGRIGAGEKGEERSSKSLRGKKPHLASGSEFESNEALTQGGGGVEEKDGGEEDDGGGAGANDVRDDLSSVSRQEEE